MCILIRGVNVALARQVIIHQNVGPERGQDRVQHYTGRKTELYGLALRLMKI